MCIYTHTRTRLCACVCVCVRVRLRVCVVGEREREREREISKMFERIIAKQLTNFLEDHHLQSPRQFDFRRGRSTSDILLLLSNSWHDALDPGRPSLMIALDITGAFDCVWHRGLTAKLEQMGITGDLLHLFSSYLSARRC